LFLRFLSTVTFKSQLPYKKVAFTPTAEHEHTPEDDTDSEDHLYELPEEEVETQPVPKVNVDASNKEANSDIPKKKIRGPNKQWIPNPEYVALY